MTKDKLYRLMDILDDLKKIDSIISEHSNYNSETSSLMLSQYLDRRNQLLVYFINEINASVDLEETPIRLDLIKQIMERFFKQSIIKKQDSQIDTLFQALSA